MHPAATSMNPGSFSMTEPLPPRVARSRLASQIRTGLEALRDNSSYAQFERGLRPRVRALLGSRTSPPAEDQLLSDFAIACVRDDLRPLKVLLSLPDEQLIPAVRRRLRQLRVEAIPHWNLLRTLRAHVRRAVKDEVPAGEEQTPIRLQDDTGDWSYQAVQKATWVAIRSDRALVKRPNVIADGLFRRFGPQAETGTDDLETQLVPDEGLAPDDRYHLYVEAQALMEQLRRELGPEAFAVFALRVKGLGLEEIGQQLGHGTTWAHQRFQEALGIVESFKRNHGLADRTVLAVARKAARAKS